MKKIRLLKTVIWGVNILLTMGILLFFINCILFPTPVNRLKEIENLLINRRPNAPQEPPFDSEIVWKLPLPMVVPEKGGHEARPLSEYFRLIATMPGNPESLGIAVIQVRSIGETRVVGVGSQPMLRRGQPAPPGVKLVRVDQDAAYFDDHGKEQKLDKEKNPAPALPRSIRPGAP